MEQYVDHIRSLVGAAGKLMNLPYTILGSLVVLSVVARLILILQ